LTNRRKKAANKRKREAKSKRKRRKSKNSKPTTIPRGDLLLLPKDLADASGSVVGREFAEALLYVRELMYDNNVTKLEIDVEKDSGKQIKVSKTVTAFIGDN
jgi:hypothetical protein